MESDSDLFECSDSFSQGELVYIVMILRTLNCFSGQQRIKEV